MRVHLIVLLLMALTAAWENSKNTTTSNHIELRQPAPPQIRLFHNWEFHGFPDLNTVNVIKIALADAFILADVAALSINCPVWTTSYLRYFKPEYADRVRAVFYALLYQRLDSGDPFHLWWGDHPNDNIVQRCANTEAQMYIIVNDEQILNLQGTNVFFCPRMLLNRWSLGDVPCASLLPWADKRNMETIASAILHELLHGPQAGAAAQAPGNYIDDMNMPLPGGDKRAFGPYWAAHINQGIDTLPYASLYNVDNYLYFALENYFMSTCSIREFADPQIGQLNMIYDVVNLGAP